MWCSIKNNNFRWYGILVQKLRRFLFLSIIVKNDTEENNDCSKYNIFHLKLPSWILRGHERPQWELLILNFTCIIGERLFEKPHSSPDRVCSSSFSSWDLHLLHTQTISFEWSEEETNDFVSQKKEKNNNKNLKGNDPPDRMADTLFPFWCSCFACDEGLIRFDRLNF